MSPRVKIAGTFAALFCMFAGAAIVSAAGQQAPAPGQDPWDVVSEVIKDTRYVRVIDRHLGKPYVWGSTGPKGYDCSGFIWRVMLDSGVFWNRTTARKMYLMLPDVPPEDRFKRGTVVFFNSLKHVGLVNDGKTFWHAQSSRGTNLSNFDPYWRKLIVGYKRLPEETFSE